MKKLLFTAFLGLALSFTSHAQSYGPVEWDIIGFSIVIPTSDNFSGGFGIYTEPRFNVDDKFSVGLRLDLALLGSNIDDDSASVGASTSFSVMGDYYLRNNENKRAFVGLGLGLFGGGELEIDTGGTTTGEEGGGSFGIIPRVGYEFGLLRLALEYNLAFEEVVPSYLAFKFGFNIGGRAK